MKHGLKEPIMTTSTRGKAICLPFDSEDSYRLIVNDPQLFRDHLNRLFATHPELFPRAFDAGFVSHDLYYSAKLQVTVRRIRLKSTGDSFLVRPSFIMPYCVSRTDLMDKALYLKQWAVPDHALAYVLGGNPSIYRRAFLSMGRPSLVGTTVKSPHLLPDHLVADEKHTKACGRKVFVTTTAAKGCFMGASVVPSAGFEDLKTGYGDFAKEARELNSDYAPVTVCLDGWSPTQNAFTALFPTLVVILCFLHSALKVATACFKRMGALRDEVLERTWQVYRAPNKRSFAQRIRRLRQWTVATVLPTKVKEVLLKVCDKKAEFMRSYDHEGGHRTSNMVDRLMDRQDRVLFAQRYFHGSLATARLAVRAQALLYNFHPYSPRLRQRQPQRASPFEDLNGFSYHPNWLHNFLIASSMGGHPP